VPPLEGQPVDALAQTIREAIKATPEYAIDVRVRAKDALDSLVALVARFTEELADRGSCVDALADSSRALDAAVRDAATLRAALTAIKAQQPETLAMIEANGFVFTDIGRDPGNWQHLAFTVYTDLCRVDTIAEQALAAAAPTDEPRHQWSVRFGWVDGDGRLSDGASVPADEPGET
jgi:hypothetical protein